MNPTDVDLLTPLRDHFDLHEFKPGQERIIRDLLTRRDVLAVLPTGGGKSLVYQLTAQLLRGLTIVVSPLLALMRDQVESIEEHGLEVGFVNSTLTDAEAEEELDKALEGAAKLLYVTPERFADPEFMDEIRGQKVSLFVVDEAHCVSDWGHSFRPAYLTLDNVADQLGRPVRLALTATATPWIRREIGERLGLRHPDLVVEGTDRPNLFFEVQRVEEAAAERQTLYNLLFGDPPACGDTLTGQLKAAMDGPGIIYTATTKAAEETARWLQDWGIAADYYHGQRKAADRARVQDAFMEGDLRVIACTNAFGMGVDKPDVRWVIHRDIPASLEAYYQEAGRAGRDGQFARCVLLYRPAALGQAAFLAATGHLTPEDVTAAHAALRATPDAPSADLLAASGLNEGDFARVIALLERARLVQERKGRIRLLVDDFDPAAVTLESEERRRAYEKSRLDMMRGYAETRDCRRAYILNYFGEDYAPGACNHCDNECDLLSGQRVPLVCAAAAADRPVAAGSADFPLGTRVTHTTWGAGTVQRATGQPHRPLRLGWLQNPRL